MEPLPVPFQFWLAGQMISYATDPPAGSKYSDAPLQPLTILKNRKMTLAPHAKVAGKALPGSMGLEVGL